MNYFLAIAIALAVAPIGGIYYFLIAQYRRRLSLGKYILLLFYYVLMWALTVYALTSRFINVTVFVVIHLGVLFAGVWRERVAFVKELKSIANI
jgi:hypothetical protein